MANVGGPNQPVIDWSECATWSDPVLAGWDWTGLLGGLLDGPGLLGLQTGLVVRKD